MCLMYARTKGCPKSESAAFCGSNAVSQVKIGQKLAFVAQSARRAVFELKSVIPFPQVLVVMGSEQDGDLSLFYHM